jgi:hypothetical protein
MDKATVSNFLQCRRPFRPCSRPVCHQPPATCGPCLQCPSNHKTLACDSCNNTIVVILSQVKLPRMPSHLRVQVYIHPRGLQVSVEGVLSLSRTFWWDAGQAARRSDYQVRGNWAYLG